ncbi:hypothetical protein [Pseudarthrobacter sp. SSS035]|nr:hypothetical protein [Pseudarthrobacter sp. SSS035]
MPAANGQQMDWKIIGAEQADGERFNLASPVNSADDQPVLALTD